MEPRRLFISAGHSNVIGKDTGADGLNGVKEGMLTVELRNKVINELKLLNVYTYSDPDKFVTKDTVIIVNALLDCRDIALDIHFNSFHNPIAHGTEVLVPFKSSIFERDLAKTLSKNVASIIETVDRGYITEAQSARGSLIFMRPNCENILLEVCFITNKDDLEKYTTKKDLVAKVIADTVFNFLTK